MTARERQARQARTALLWGLLGVVGLQLGMTAVVEKWVPVFRDPNYVFKATRLKKRLRETPGRPKLALMVGSSHVAAGLRGNQVEADMARELGRPVVLYNFGIPGDNPMNELLNFERLLAEGVRPDLLLVEVLPSLLSRQSAYQFQVIPAERMGVRDRLLLLSQGMPVGQLRRNAWLWWAAPWYAHRLEILTALLPKLLPGWMRQDLARACDESGWFRLPYDASPEGRRRALQEAFGSYRLTLQHFALGNPFCQALHRVLDRCRREGIPAALVLMPEGPVFRTFYSADAWLQMGAFLDELTTTYGVPLIDARTWVDDEQAFVDSHHLLPDGAAVFSRRLGREAVVPLLREPPVPK